MIAFSYTDGLIRKTALKIDTQKNMQQGNTPLHDPASNSSVSPNSLFIVIGYRFSCAS